MTKRMLIDASHAEETRVVVLDGTRLDDFDVETQTKKQLKGNIYLAKIVRVEPSLQAAFVEYGGNRHGFLAFGEIHPDYYQIPVADRQRLLRMQEEEAREDEERDEPDSYPSDRNDEAAPLTTEPESSMHGADEEPDPGPVGADMAPESADAASADGTEGDGSRVEEVAGDPAPPPESLGGDGEGGDDTRGPRATPRFLRSYKIQEVIRRRQILLIQVVKEERGTKGAALTTYISLAGRYCVLMPNSPRGGGISRKITSAADRRRLKEITTELEIPRGMGLIVRTAGASRPKPEIRRDCEYLLRLWDDIRDTTMASVAPAQIHEEASLIKRAIRDVYSRDIDEILVDGEEGWKAARDFMRMLMPTHVKKVQLWRDGGVPLFARTAVEAQLDAMLSPNVQLRSGGYLVINQTEALVAIDVNSGRSTRERGIEETALRTNLEAADEVARQLRLRDLAGLIVIDFIDMEAKKHNAAVERRLKDALKNDRARIQVGHISHFGLMEMSRQRLRPSLAESSLDACPHCAGSGQVRSTESAALHVLRTIEEEGSKRRAAEILVYVAGPVALYILNHKRDRLSEIEARYTMATRFEADASLLPGQTRIEKLRAQTEIPPPLVATPMPAPVDDADEPDLVEDEDVVEETGGAAEAAAQVAEDRAAAASGETPEEGERRRKRRRRRRRGGRRDDAGPADAEAPMPPDAEQPDIRVVPIHASYEPVAAEPVAEIPAAIPEPEPAPVLIAEAPEAAPEEAPKRKRPSRARKPKLAEGAEPAATLPLGPTPADPFASGGQDIFAVLEAVEMRAAQPAPRPGNGAAVAPPPAEAELLAAAPDEAPARPVVAPIVIGQETAAPAEKRRGWWKR